MFVGDRDKMGSQNLNQWATDMKDFQMSNIGVAYK